MAANLKFRRQNSSCSKNTDISQNERLLTSTYHSYSLPRPLWYVITSLVGLGCFWSSLHCDLVHDDVFAIKENLDVRQEAPLSRVFLDDFWGKPMSSKTSHKSYRPLCILTFRLNYMIHGLHPFGYHLVNVVLHLIVSLLYVFVCETVVVKSLPVSVVAGLLFVSHPVHTEAVSINNQTAKSRALTCYPVATIQQRRTFQQCCTTIVRLLMDILYNTVVEYCEGRTQVYYLQRKLYNHILQTLTTFCAY